MAEVAAQLDCGQALFDASGVLEVIIFNIEKTHYAIPISQVRYIEQDNRDTTRVDSSAGSLEVIQYQNQTVPICEFSSLVSTEPDYLRNQVLVDQFLQFQQDHLDWFNALELSLRDGCGFKKEKDPNQCEFGRWYNRFDPADEALSDILVHFDEIHKEFHGLADALLAQSGQGDNAGALDKLNSARKTVLERLNALFLQAVEQVKNKIRPVLVFVTRGDSKLQAVRLNAINEIRTYQIRNYAPTEAKASELGNDLDIIVGYLHNEDQTNAPCVLLDWQRYQ